MKLIKTLSLVAAFSLPVTALVGCGMHGENTSPDYQINRMERMDKQTVKQQEKMKRMLKEGKTDQDK